MFRYSSNIQLGSFSFKGGYNSIVIKRSSRDFMDTAVIKLPALSRVKNKSGQPASSGKTEKLFKEGDKVLISLGYNDDNHQEFAGFIRRVSPSVPTVIECEGYGWQLRRKQIGASWKNTTLRQVLEEVVRGTDVTLSPLIPDLPLTNFSIINLNGLQVLEYLRDKLLLTPFFSLNELYVGLQLGMVKNKVNLRLGWNVIKDELKSRLAEETKVLVKIKTGKGKKNERIEYEAGDKDGSVREIDLPNVQDNSWVKLIAEDALAKAKYTGFEGSVTCFLQPFVEPSYEAAVVDKKDDRSGSYFVIGTELTMDMQGARRKVHIGSKLK